MYFMSSLISVIDLNYLSLELCALDILLWGQYVPMTGSQQSIDVFGIKMGII